MLHDLLILLDGFLHELSLSVVLEAASWDLVQSEDGLVRILDQDVLALISLQTHVNNGSDNTPSI